MSAARQCAVLLAIAAMNGSWATQRGGVGASGAEPDAMQSLQQRLLSLADERLRPAGLSLDRARVWLILSGPLPAGAEIVVQPLWPADKQMPALPLRFELRPMAPSGAAGTPVQATLAAPLLREVGVAMRRLTKGSAAGCADVSVQRRAVLQLSPSALVTPCDLPPGAVALRDVSAGAVLRHTDLGLAPAVMAGSSVDVQARVRGVSVVTSATALADAKVGDRIDVRLQRPARRLRTVVTGPGSVQLMEGSL